jgi:hypothetical protein
MRSLLLIAMVLSVGGASCGGCIDDESKPKAHEEQVDALRVRRQRAVGTILSVVDGGASAAQGDL